MVSRIAAVVVVLAAALVTPAVAALAPTLRVVRERPLVLQGTAFKPREVISVTIRMRDRTWTRPARANARGSFTFEFSRVRIDFCARPLRIVAHGARTGTVPARLPVRNCPSP
jgi:hypothetical protein